MQASTSGFFWLPKINILNSIIGYSDIKLYYIFFLILTTFIQLQFTNNTIVQFNWPVIALILIFHTT
jgi:hypothetical protein